MRRFDVGDIVFLSADLGRLVRVLKDSPKDEFRNKDHLRNDLETLRQDVGTLSRLGLPMAVAHLKRMIGKFEVDDALILELDVAAMYEELINRIQDECHQKCTVVLRADARQLLEPESPLFGDEVARAFPRAGFDIDEAAKCIAAERGTAAVMHLMRVLELGLRALAKSLGLEFQPSWDAYIRKINALLDSPENARTKSKRITKEKLRAINGDLLATKHAWRNPAMHVEGAYTLEEAAVIFRLSRVLMNRIATDLPRRSTFASKLT